MTNVIIEDLKAVIAKVEAALEPAEAVIVADAEAAGAATISYVKANGLQDLYQIALTLVGAAVPGASWTGTLSAIETQAVADGKQILNGSVAVVAAQAQADLLAAGKLLSPTATTATEPAASSSDGTAASSASGTVA